MPPEPSFPEEPDLVALREQPRPEFRRALDERMAAAIAREREREARPGLGARLTRLPRVVWAGGGVAAVAAAVLVVVVSGGGSSATKPSLSASVAPDVAPSAALAAPSAAAPRSAEAGKRPPPTSVRLAGTRGHDVRITYRAQTPGALRALLLDSSRHAVARIDNVHIPAGSGTVTLHAKHVRPGRYHLAVICRAGPRRTLAADVTLP